MKRSVLWILLLLCLGLTGCNTTSSLETKTLTLAVFDSGYGSGEANLMQWVERYNDSHPDVKIEVVNYLENYSDPYEAINKLKIEISAGNGPDMINFGGLYSPLDVSSGMMADLYPFMHNDKSFDDKDFYFNILQSFEAVSYKHMTLPTPPYV